MYNPNSNIVSNRFNKKCLGPCKQRQPVENFDKLSNGDTARYCKVCKPPQDVNVSFAFLEGERVSTPCKLCGKHLVYWYKANGKLCDVFDFAARGYSLPYIQRFLAQLIPKCEPCSRKPSPIQRSIQLTKQAAGWKRKALMEQDSEKARHYWVRHFILANAAIKAALGEQENSSHEARTELDEAELDLAIDTYDFGGTDEI